MILSFINRWYQDQLIDTSVILSLIISIILFISWIKCLVSSIKEKTKLNIISLIIVIITALLTLFFPFREIKTKLDLNLYEEKYIEVINLIKDNKLKPDNLGNIKLANKYKNITTSNEVVVYQNNDNGQVIAFWIFRGLQSGSVQLIYSTGKEKLIMDNETGHPIISIDKLKDNWYYVITDY